MDIRPVLHVSLIIYSSGKLSPWLTGFGCLIVLFSFIYGHVNPDMACAGDILWPLSRKAFVSSLAMHGYSSNIILENV